MSNFTLTETNIKNLVRITRKKNLDQRGSFEKILSRLEFNVLGINFHPSQINLSYSKNIGTLRGLHYSSSPTPESKLVTCLEGAVFDVVIDLRRNSTTYLEVFQLILKENDGLSLLIPGGCAHGFQVLNKNSTLLYVHSEEYEPNYDAGIHYADPCFSIQWPLKTTVVSNKDAQLPHWRKDEM